MVNKTFIIIVTYNAMQWLPKCLESTKPYPVIIVDNNSQDDTIKYIEKEYPEVPLFKQEKNLGFGQANNIGISYALKEGADYVFLLNQDAYLQDGCLEKLIATHQKNDDYGVLSPIHLNGRGNFLDEKFGNHMRINKFFYPDFVVGKSIKEIYEVPFINAAGWLLSKKCLKTVGGFDPIFFHYGEDDNYCQRVVFHDLKIGVVPGSFLLHDREDRKKNPIEPFSLLYFQVLERKLKIKYADITKPDYFEIKLLIRKRKKSLIKSLLQFNFKTANNLNKELNIIRRLLNSIRTSRNLNKTKGYHYLNT